MFKKILKIIFTLSFTLIIFGYIAGCKKEKLSNEPYIFVKKWGSEGSWNSYFKNPSSIIIDKNGYIYLADKDNSRIQKFDSNGKFVEIWMTEGKGKYNTPTDIAIDSKGNVYVVDGSNYKVQKFTSNGQFIDKWGEYDPDKSKFRVPRHIAIDSNDFIYISANYNDKPYRASVIWYDPNTFPNELPYIQKFDPELNFIKEWNVGDEAIIDEQVITDIAINSSNIIYIILNIPWKEDRSQTWSSIYQFTFSGDLIDFRSIGNDTSGIGIDSEDNIFLTEFSNNRIIKLSSNGNSVVDWGSKGSGNGQFIGPTDVAIDSSGNVYVVDSGNHRIQKFTPNPDYKPKNSNQKEE